MSLGAAGCGAEYTNPPHRCTSLIATDKHYKCTKYDQYLRSHNSGLPIRCTQCSKDAGDYWDKKLAEEKSIKTYFARMK